MRSASVVVAILVACPGGTFAQVASGKQTPQEKWKTFYAQVVRFRETGESRARPRSGA
jgi:hypothetical protein